MTAWNRTFERRTKPLAAMALRGALGTNGAGSGALDFAATVMAVHRNTIPPSLNTADVDPMCRFQFAQDGPKDAHIRQALSVGFALAGGQQAALVVRKFQESA
jgi:3-oxoacyl-(acyl-carrier-protein) synthase